MTEQHSKLKGNKIYEVMDRKGTHTGVLVAKDTIGAEDAIIQGKGNPADFLVVPTDEQIQEDLAGTFRMIENLVKGYLAHIDRLAAASQYRHDQYEQMSLASNKLIRSDKDLADNIIERKEIGKLIWVVDKDIAEEERQIKATGQALYKLVDQRDLPNITLEIQDHGNTVVFKNAGDALLIDGDPIRH